MLFRRFRRKPLLISIRAILLTKTGKLGAALISAGLAVTIIVTILFFRLKPIIMDMAAYYVTDLVSQMINESVSEKINDGSLDYSNLITLEKDSQGNIKALVTNMAKINLLQTDILNSSIDRVSTENLSVIKIPVGTVIGGPLLSGRGPSIPVKILSVVNSSAKFYNEFTAAGINQTRHQIMLNINMDVKILVPWTSDELPVAIEIIVAETVIVGDVPDTYALLDGMMFGGLGDNS